MKHSRRLRSILRDRNEALPRTKNLRLHIAGLDHPVTQALDGQTMTGGNAKASVSPARNQGRRHAKLLSQARGTVGVDKGCKVAHGQKFSKSKVLAPVESLECQKVSPKGFGYPEDMNIPWHIKAKARLKELNGRRSGWHKRSL